LISLRQLHAKVERLPGRFSGFRPTACDAKGLWAEARDRYLAGEKWWIDEPELIAAATEEQAARQIEDARQL
jgi:hypothetical protein